ncbi:ANTAR domain-containing protein [Tabrizicola sp.]|uniref:ANTAR domain-containing response regulator n=1 Tax=Tabrizicola sp. TaxID=2005166 RepID=UPI0025D464FC|nr:ANTAR domain-containing protein [Tabrizicola sp.]MBY0351887.1 ANTAR domain-containing protein [Tabrizicola sp.]
MTGAVARLNFRGARALILLQEESGAAVLVRTLERLGLQITDSSAEAEIVFVDADEEFSAPARDIPVVALIGSEAPSRLGRVVRQRASACLMKPIRPTGIFTAVFVAFNEHAARQREAQEREALRRRAEGRRVVIKAILHLMAKQGLTDDEAYRELRLASMRRRMSVEEFAAETVAASTSSMRLGDPLTQAWNNKQT